MKTKFEIQELLGIGLTLVVLGIGIAYGLQVMSDIDADMAEDSCNLNSYEHYVSTSQACYRCPNSTWDNFDSTAGNVCVNQTVAGNNISAVRVGNSVEANASDNAISGVAKLPEKIPTIATVIVAAVIIGILVTYLWGRFQ